MRRPWALPFVPVYGAGLRLKNRLYDAGVLSAHELRWPVISVGSLSAGGAGKTPVVVMLAGLLERQGLAVDVLSRGYGRTSRAIEEVDTNGPAKRFGDEPLEIARAGLRVFVGADRFAAGALAESRESLPQGREVGSTGAKRGVHVLDDGFQHRRLRRALDVVLLTAEDAKDGLLPAGNLREPLASLGRAGAVVLREEEAQRLRPVVARYTQAEVWVIQRMLVLPERRLRRPVVFCGVARPEGFLRMLEQAGCKTAGQIRFRDHQHYRNEDIGRVLALARNTGADGYYTTAKDAVKLLPEWRARLEEVGPVEVVGLSVRFRDEAQALQQLLRCAKEDRLVG